MMKRSDKGLLIMLMIVFLGSYFFAIKYQNTDKTPETISTNGLGKSLVIPDTLTISLNISEEGESSKIAQKKMEEKLVLVQKLLANHKIPKEKIKTSNLTVNPKYSYKDGERTLLGRQVSNALQIEITGKEYEKTASKILASLPNLGGIIVDSTDFIISDPNAGYAEARKKSFEDAKTKAEQLANLAGRKLGKTITINDGGAQNSYPIMRAYTMEKSAMLSDEMANENLLSKGQIERQYRVWVVFELK